MKTLIPLVLAGAATAVGCGGGRLTESQEYYVGRGVAANAMFDSSGRAVGPVNNPALEEYVNLVGLTLALESDRSETFKGYHFAVVNSGDINAFAAPGGFVFVTLGAIRQMQSEDELAGVLAHEVAHVVLRHPEDHANRAANQAGVMGILSTGAHIVSIGLSLAGKQTAAENLQTVTKGFTEVLDGFLKEIMVNGYGRESELKADAYAVDLLTRPGVRYDPGALKAFIGRLPKKDRGAWSTHPGLEGRMQAVEEEIKKRGAVPSTDPGRTDRFKAMTAGLRGQ
ncbi:MAG TPA: M48 family metalloprotease [Planctomycetota bacterium]|nr:M48 family metalloprotease [Planctomycetota bacterium]